jgi:hypothetical protein
MRNTLLVIAAGFALSLSTAALADESAATAQPQQTSSSSTDGDKVICRQMSHDGILTPKVYCNTKRGWDRMRMASEQNVNEIQIRALSRPVK